ncbi:MAG: hypothetical protein Q9217_001085 [Psora testacea]
MAKNEQNREAQRTQKEEESQTNRAIVANDQLDYCIRDDVPLLPISDDCVIIKTKYVGLNPVDTKMVGPFVGVGAIYGGADIVASGRLKLGDRVAGGADGMQALRPQSGAFAEYASIDGGMALKLPDDVSFEVGAGMPLRVATSAMALFHSLQLTSSLLEKVAEEPFDVLVYGDATSMGAMAIQLLKRCGLRVITTCSPRNFDLVRSYCADTCFDYNSPTCGADIRAFTDNALEYALDCITEEITVKISTKRLAAVVGNVRLPCPLPFDSTRNNKQT